MCKSEDIEKNVKEYIETFVKYADVNAYKKLKELSSADYKLGSAFSISENQELIAQYKDEQRAKLFKEKADVSDLDQRIIFLDISLLLLPKDSSLSYEYYIDNAQAQVFLYRLCCDTSFREELKTTNSWSEEELNSAYSYNAEAVSVNNLVYAIQTLNESSRFAKNLDEINRIDEQVQKIIELIKN